MQMDRVDATVFGGLSQQCFQYDHVVLSVAKRVIEPSVRAVIEYSGSGSSYQVKLAFADSFHQLVLVSIAVF